MPRTMTTAFWLACATVAATVTFGWIVAIGQLLDDGWLAGGGTAWLIAAAAIATVAAVAAFAAHRAGRRGLAALSVAFVAASPTVFAYPLNLLVLGIAVIEVRAAIAGRSVTTN